MKIRCNRYAMLGCAVGLLPLILSGFSFSQNAQKYEAELHTIANQVKPRVVNMDNLKSNPWYRNNFQRYGEIKFNPVLKIQDVSSIKPISFKKVVASESEEWFIGNITQLPLLDNSYSISGSGYKVGIAANELTSCRYQNGTTSWTEYYSCGKYCQVPPNSGGYCMGGHERKAYGPTYASKMIGIKTTDGVNHTLVDHGSNHTDSVLTPEITVNGVVRNGVWMDIERNPTEMEKVWLKSNNPKEFDINRLIMVDDTTTLSGIDNVNLGLKADDDYLKSIFVLSTNLSKANELIASASADELKNENFLVLIKALVEGKIVDTGNQWLKDIGITHNDVGGIEQTFTNYYSLYMNNLDITQLLAQTPLTRYGDYALAHNLEVNDPYLAYKLSNLFLNKIGNTNENFAGLQLELNFISRVSDRENFPTVLSRIKFNESNKKFELLTVDGNSLTRGVKVTANDTYNDNDSVKLLSVDIVNNTESQNYAKMQPREKISIMENNIAKIYNEKGSQASSLYNINTNISKAIVIKNDWNYTELANTLGREFTTAELQTPSLILNDGKIVNKLLTFRNPSNTKCEQPIKIVDPTLEERMINSKGDTLLTNEYFIKITDSLKVNSYDSVNGVGVDINYKSNVKKRLNTDSGDEIAKTNLHNRFQTMWTPGEPIGNVVLSNTVSGFKLDSSLKIEDDIPNNLVSFKGDAKPNTLLLTDLDEIDWKANSKRAITIATTSVSKITGILEYYDKSDGKAFFGKKSDSRDLKTLEFTINLDKESDVSNMQKSSGAFNWSLMLYIGTPGAILIICVIIIVICKTKQRNRLLKDEGDDE